MLKSGTRGRHSEPPHRSLDLQGSDVDAVDRIERNGTQVILPAGDVVISGDPRMIPDQPLAVGRFRLRCGRGPEIEDDYHVFEALNSHEPSGQETCRTPSSCPPVIRIQLAEDPHILRPGAR